MGRRGVRWEIRCTSASSFADTVTVTAGFEVTVQYASTTVLGYYASDGCESLPCSMTQIPIRTLNWMSVCLGVEEFDSPRELAPNGLWSVLGHSPARCKLHRRSI